MKLRLFSLALLLCGGLTFSQDYFPENEGIKSKNNNYRAFTNARIYVSANEIIENGTLLIKNGKIVQVGASVSIPKNTVIEDVKGLSIYPSFIEVVSGFGVDKPKRAPRDGRSAQYGPDREGFYWNDHIRPENNAVEKFKYDQKKAETLRKVGFGLVNAHIEDGIARGSGVLIALNDEGNEGERVIDTESAQYFSFSKSIASKQSYPTSLMGATALMRQLHHDLRWYEAGNAVTTDRSLEALIANKNQAQLFLAGDNGNVIRADKIGDQFGVNYTILGGGDEYERIDAIKKTNATLVVPINFPKAYDVSDPYAASYVNLAEMRHWNLAPSNPKVLEDNSVNFALTTHELSSPSDFASMLQKALSRGLSKEKALEALTTVPAKILGKSDQIGSLKSGAMANFLLTSGDIFDQNTTIFENWVQGVKHTLANKDLVDIRGTYNLRVNGTSYNLNIKGKASKPNIEIKKDSIKIPSKITYTNDWFNMSFSTDGDTKTYVLNGLAQSGSENLNGKVIYPDGRETTFIATKSSGPEDMKGEKATQETTHSLMTVTYPNIGYGNTAKPKPQNWLFKNATVWTGIEKLENTDVLVKNGKISKVGKDLKANGATEVDATGKHLTAGVIDEHSHIGGLSINEAGQNSSAEVRMTDVLDPKDINLYRNLGGGVTTFQLLHGSANPIGGQSAIIKLKWGEDAEGLQFPDMPKFIKFALGENVKQSNWSSYARFPQTRMGVEQVFVNYFQRAKEYDTKKKSGQPYRVDEDLEALAEILNGERFISCHSYVQSEINMLMKVADQFGITVNTFTHILEGYKVADKMAEHGAGGSTFSDWWAYKYEVKDAIPYNAKIMADQGVVVAINSDDREMSRRLNQEAGKTIKYGGMSEIEAWKTVTLNPAKLLHIDHRVGSIKEGMDADLVLWSDYPMSIYAKAEKTIIEGAVYFDLEKDKAQRAAIQKERATLIQMMLNEKASGGKTQKPKMRSKRDFHCETI
ncbi:amidohydrolase family protein [Croceivirga thetidis]|uniref:Amidohydrolase family protein n=1 Tax=Croceivirga thetidis TaxID=2721623 RepID=A0ABX1GSD5_9FLAO|nr:amidohydrolase family protein [Croceivirga thetidis]NKI32836.1 amidohydrolase family protein [Croceivirga thetidis]